MPIERFENVRCILFPYLLYNLSMAKSSPPGTGGGKPSTLAGYVTEAIRSGILERRYPLGSRLDQQALADELGASIIPVRESLRQLEAEGLVQIAPRRGPFVVSPTIDEVREVYRLREVLEVFATREAVPLLTAEDLAELDALLAEMAQAASDDTSETWPRLNQAWHFKLYGGARLPLLMQFISTLWDRSRLTSHLRAQDLSHRTRSIEDHNRIIVAVRAHDAESAAGLIANHVRSAMGGILDQNLAEQPA